MLTFNSALLASAADFVGAYAPYQGIELRPAEGRGVFVSSTDHGNVAFIAFDPNGSGDESMVLLPDSDLVKTCRGIKTADREIRLNGATAVVTTYRKASANQAKELPFTRSTTPFPPLASVMRSCIDRWSMTPELTSTAGRYNGTYIEKAVKALAAYDDAVVMSAFDGGPLRLQGDRGNITILVMPQTAQTIPPVAEWLNAYAT